MPDLGPLALVLALLYGAAALGVAAGLLVRAWDRSGGRAPVLAAWGAWLPVGAALVLPFAAVLPHADGALHALWHYVQEVLHASALAHAALHALNTLLLVLGLAGLARAAFTAGQICAFGSAVRRAVAAASCGGQVRVLESDRPLCFAQGTLRPAIYVTTGLLGALPECDLAAVLAHERAHLRRRDNLTGTVLTLFYAFFFLPGTGVLLRDWRQAAERACDTEAAREVGSACDVAAALVRAAGLIGGAGPLPAGVGFADDAAEIEDRVRALLDGSPERGFAPAALALALAFVLSGSFWLPHAAALIAHH
jgi:Zn-dependent protease with chaperone function